MTVFDRTAEMTAEEIEKLKPFGFAPGSYLHSDCKKCHGEFTGDKYAAICRECAEKLAAQAPRQHDAFTAEQKRHICAELARRRGYSVVKDGTYFYLLDAHGGREENADGYPVASTCEDGAWADAPNPFTDAAASRALVEWATESDRRSADFFKALCILLDIIPTWIEGYSGPVYSPSEVKRIMTAPLETIARAAYQAITAQASLPPAAPAPAPPQAPRRE